MLKDGAKITLFIVGISGVASTYAAIGTGRAIYRQCKRCGVRLTQGARVFCERHYWEWRTRGSHGD